MTESNGAEEAGCLFIVEHWGQKPREELWAHVESCDECRQELEGEFERWQNNKPTVLYMVPVGNPRIKTSFDLFSAAYILESRHSEIRETAIRELCRVWYKRPSAEGESSLLAHMESLLRAQRHAVTLWHDPQDPAGGEEFRQRQNELSYCLLAKRYRQIFEAIGPEPAKILFKLDGEVDLEQLLAGWRRILRLED